MKITEIRSMLLQGPRPHSVGGEVGTARKLLVRVDTDDPRLYGLGECEFFMGVREGIEYCRSVLLGRNPFDVRPAVSEIVYGTLPPHPTNARWDKRQFRSIMGPCQPMSPTATPDGPIVWAISGIEQALVDVVGKALKTPAYNLLGGRFRERVRVYLDRSSPADQEDL